MSYDMFKTLVAHPRYRTSLTYSHILGMIDWKKLQNRMYKAWMNPTIEQRCVLFEYNVYDPSPFNDMSLHRALHQPDFVRFMDSVFKNNNSRIQIYSRKKIRDGKVDYLRRQLVVVFQTWSMVPPPPPPPVLERQNAIKLEDLDFGSETNSYVDEDDAFRRDCHCCYD